MTNRRRLRLAASLACTLGLLVSAVAPVNGAWSSTTVDSSWYLTRPSLAVDSADHTSIAYMRSGSSPGIIYDTNATGSWVSTRVTSASDFAPSLQLDAGDDPHVAFARRSGTTGIYLTNNTSGTWAAPVLAAADLDPSLPSMDINAAGKHGIAYTSNYSFAPGLYYATDATGSWVRTRITSATWESTPWLRFNAAGHALIMFARYAPENPGIYFTTNATGAWVTTKVKAGLMDSVQFELDASGKVHAAFRSIEGTGSDHVSYATNKSGSWVVTAVPAAPGVGFGPPTLARDPAGETHIFVAAYQPDTGSGANLAHFVVSESGVCCTGSGDTPQDDRIGDDDYPSLGFRSDGRIQLAFRRLHPSAGLRFFEFGIFSSLIAGSRLVNNGASIDLGLGGVRDIAYNRREGANGVTVFATGSGASWALDVAGTGVPSRFATDISADGSGKVRIVDGSAFYSNASGPWTSPTSQPPRAESEVEVDSLGRAHVLVSQRIWPYWQLDYKTDASGSWVSSSPVPATGFEGNPQATLALDAAGKPHVVWIYYVTPTDQSLRYQNRVSGTWTTIGNQVSGGLNAWPSIAIDAGGKAHVAWIKYGASPGIYYATNKTGVWVSTRITRSYSDGPPSLALDGAGHAYIGTTRSSFASNPGVYVATNTTGAWVVSRVVASDLAGDVSLSVTSGGLVRMVFDTLDRVIEYENSTATLAAGASADQAVIDVVKSQLAAAASRELDGTWAAPQTSAGQGGPAVGGGAANGDRTTTVPIRRGGAPASK